MTNTAAAVITFAMLNIGEQGVLKTAVDIVGAGAEMAFKKAELKSLPALQEKGLLKVANVEYSASKGAPKGQVGIRPTDLGVSVYNAHFNPGGVAAEQTPNTTPATSPTPVVSGPVTNAVPLPPAKTRGARKSPYAYDSLGGVGQSFHVPCSNKRACDGGGVKTPEEMEKSLTSSITKVNNRHRLNPESGRSEALFSKHFIHRAVDSTDPAGPGVRVWVDRMDSIPTV